MWRKDEQPRDGGMDMQLAEALSFRTVTSLSTGDPLTLGVTGLAEQLIQNQLF